MHRELTDQTSSLLKVDSEPVTKVADQNQISIVTETIIRKKRDSTSTGQLKPVLNTIYRQLCIAQYKKQTKTKALLHLK